jgi:hypothetical protein
MVLRELWVTALGPYHALFPRGVRNNVAEVNMWLLTMPKCFCEAVEDGV